MLKPEKENIHTARKSLEYLRDNWNDLPDEFILLGIEKLKEWEEEWKTESLPEKNSKP